MRVEKRLGLAVAVPTVVGYVKDISEPLTKYLSLSAFVAPDPSKTIARWFHVDVVGELAFAASELFVSSITLFPDSWR